MALFEYSYARKLYYPLLSLMWICRYGVFASSVRLIHFLSHSCCTLRYHWHNTRTKSSIHLFIEIIAYAMYFQWCAHSVALNSMRMRVCIDMWTKCTRMVLIMAVSWQEVRRCTHTQSTSAKSIQNALNTSDVLILGAVFMAQNRLFSICWLDIEGSRRRKVEGEYSLPWLFLSICRYVCTLNA